MPLAIQEAIIPPNVPSPSQYFTVFLEMMNGTPQAQNGFMDMASNVAHTWHFFARWWGQTT
eukprot:4449483-Karenia_brevis.AAC.1